MSVFPTASKLRIKVLVLKIKVLFLKLKLLFLKIKLLFIDFEKTKTKWRTDNTGYGCKEDKKRRGCIKSLQFDTPSCHCFVPRNGYSLISITRFSSSSCLASIFDGASSITSRPLLFFGKAMQSRMLSRPAKRLTQRSRPYARPP